MVGQLPHSLRNAKRGIRGGAHSGVPGSPDACPFILDTDASNHAIGAVLSQKGAAGKEHVIAYGNRTLDKAERNYSITKREMLAMVSFTKKCVVFLLWSGLKNRCALSRYASPPLHSPFQQSHDFCRSKPCGEVKAQ